MHLLRAVLKSEKSRMSGTGGNSKLLNIVKKKFSFMCLEKPMFLNMPAPNLVSMPAGLRGELLQLSRSFSSFVAITILPSIWEPIAMGFTERFVSVTLISSFLNAILLYVMTALRTLFWSSFFGFARKSWISSSLWILDDLMSIKESPTSPGLDSATPSGDSPDIDLFLCSCFVN